MQRKIFSRNCIGRDEPSVPWMAIVIKMKWCTEKVMAAPELLYLVNIATPNPIRMRWARIRLKKIT